MEIKQKISNHPLLTDVEREVEIKGFTLNLDNKEFIFYYKVNYNKDGKSINIGGLPPEWKITNSYKVALRDKNLKPLPNPDYDKDVEGSEEFLTEFAFTHFTKMFASFETLLKGYIKLDDETGRFNF